MCREILIFEIFVPWRPFTQHDSHIFSYSNLRFRYSDNQSECQRNLRHFCRLMTCEWDCVANQLVPRHPIPDKFKRRTLNRFTPYRLLTIPKKKSRLNSIFIISYIYIVCWDFSETSARTNFSRRTPAKVGSNLNAKDLLGNVTDF